MHQDNENELNDGDNVDKDIYNQDIYEDDIVPEEVSTNPSYQIEEPIEPQETLENNVYKNTQNEKERNKGLEIFLLVVGTIFSFLLLSFIANCLLSASGFGNSWNGIYNEIEEYLVSQPGPDENNGSKPNPFNPNGPKVEITDDNDIGPNTLNAEQIYKKTSPSIIGVVIYENSADMGADPKGEGSGIIMSSDGYIVTNSHVIGDSKKYNVKIVMNDSTEYPGSVVGYDTRTDLAVVKIDAKNLPVAEFGNSDKLNVGSWVLAIGNPGGMDFANSLTRGIVSAVNRTVSSANPVKYLQTDAAINPGNSGGALLNMSGRVVGINTSKIVATGYEGMGFAIPINTAKSVIDDLISQGYVSGRVRLGMTGKVISEYQSKMYNVAKGIIIVEISTDSDLPSKGVAVGDILTKINGADITGFDTLFAELAKSAPGDEVTLSVYRPKTEKTRESTFEARVRVLKDQGQTQN